MKNLIIKKDEIDEIEEICNLSQNFSITFLNGLLD
jgi:hypothetical protein